MSENYSSLDKLMHDYNSFTFSTAKQYGVTPYQLRKALAQGVLEKPNTGSYVIAGYAEDDLGLISQHFSRGVVSLVSALIFYDLTDEMPLWNWMTFPKGYHLGARSVADNFIRAQYRTGRFYSEGITTQTTLNGNKIRIYSMERTLLDYWNYPDAQPYVRNDAAKRYVENPRRDYSRLLALERELYPKSTLSLVIQVLDQAGSTFS
ncbi:type IV toxin-antitoxin system AbiEi family antitoxin domain-containing protein [Schleiferilactobacillus shenzhenensis]|uniref:Transcriptional regulator n=1 Tax=Schleiferilactobacillus shenzhenensis LY-73 TaxID=1231336 RepID=U4TJ01_9LACO|nr:hypothetical protein [Schleiferilactobacillus shenzhenensis]ERL64796.1 hypothetical protein L248_0573 [Schleiferilactobacillus shenzhenensis LY-73]